MNQPHVEHEEHPAAEAPGPRPGAEPATGLRAVAGPFGLRDIVVGSAVLVMLVGSVLPFTVGSGRNLWTAFSLFYVGIGIIMPLVVAGLFTARRLAPSTRLRVGSLSLDQFASVIAVLAAVFFFLQIVYVFSVGSLLGLLGAVALLAATTFAPYIPPFAAEFSERPETPAHPVAREAKPLVRAPRPAPAPKPAAADGAGHPGTFGQPAATGPGAPQSGQVQAQQHAATGRPEAGSGAAEARSAGTGTRHESGQAGASQGAASTGAAGQAGAGQAGASQAGAGQGAAAAAGSAAAGTAAAASAPGAAGTSGGNSAGRGRDIPAGEDPLPATTVNPAVQGGAAASNTQAQESISATREENENVVEAFWFAVGTPRQIVDERTGLPLFMFYPGDWELGLEDRGHEFLVQDKRTGRIGVLRDLTNIERVSDDSSGH
ncbi:hypothetical protein ITX31_08365 [Arthrobacter gandavensis]|uniref:hypothetical protein n=1 Tax=Arthrobacter gandavensis TaxID=169960 RepID=UPI00188F7696|nr:hypothetical protein [Arthrobacter gandavensis]MBF4994123.1 hypothetical protein [Arthrobacter gandavensis]